ncbi:MAG: Maff2 family protein [Ethanoligenens sp.]
MSFINSAVTTLEVLVIAIGAGLDMRGVVNLMEGYGGDDTAAKRAAFC